VFLCVCVFVSSKSEKLSGHQRRALQRSLATAAVAAAHKVKQKEKREGKGVVGVVLVSVEGTDTRKEMDTLRHRIAPTWVRAFLVCVSVGRLQESSNKLQAIAHMQCSTPTPKKRGEEKQMQSIGLL
jgi:hypothetical protein